MLNKEHITRGEAVAGRGNYVYNNASDDPCRNFTIADCVQVGIPYQSQTANAAFIADAFNGFNRTGKTYGELLNDNEQIKLKSVEKSDINQKMLEAVAENLIKDMR